MPTSSESPLNWPRVPKGKLLQVPVRSKLVALSKRIEERYGSPRVIFGQPKSILSSAAAKLAASNGDLTALTHRERKAAVELCWGPFDDWKPRDSDVRNWLAWAEFYWISRIAISRIAVSYIRNFDPTVAATQIVGEWLGRRVDRLSGRFADFFRHYALNKGTLAIEKIAQSLASGKAEFLTGISADLKTSIVFRGSGILVAVLAAYGKFCADGSASEVTTVSQALLEKFGEAGLGGKGSQQFRAGARRSMVVGIVKWASGQRSPDAIEVAIATCLWLAGDPRQSMALWRDIPEQTLNDVETWLTARTIENLFLVIETLKTDQPQQVAPRLEFWRSYLPYIRRAYLVCAAKAQPVAERLNESYGILETSDPVHCGVLMELVGQQGDKLVVLEVNKMASALFWKPGSKAAPDFYVKGRYNRHAFLSSNDRKIAHMSHWQATFADFIERETGIRRPVGVGRSV